MRQFIPFKRQAGPGAHLWTVLVCLLLLLFAGTAPLQAGSGGPTFRYGAVFTRGIVYGPNNQPIYVEYDDSGLPGTEIGEAVGPLANAQVMASEAYRAYLLQLSQLQSQYLTLELVDRASYAAGGYTTLDGQAIDKKTLRAATLVVALLPPELRYSTDPAQLILLELPIDPQYQPQADSRSLLLGEEGTILWDSRLNIGYKTGLGRDADGNETAGNFFSTKAYFGPIVGVKVENTLGQTSTDENGRFGLNYPLPPCPGFYYKMELDLFSELYYKRFNPRGGTPIFPYFMKRDNLDICNGLGGGGLARAAIVSEFMPIYERNFIVDLMVLASHTWPRGSSWGPRPATTARAPPSSGWRKPTTTSMATNCPTRRCWAI
jgi:hypothetical protein